MSYLAKVIPYIVLFCLNSQAIASQDPLPSWNDTELKKSILNYVSDVTEQSNELFQPAEKRIAVFDNDGTLWNEKPVYIHLQAVFHSLNQQLESDPTLANRQPWATIASGKPDPSHYVQMFSQESFGLESIIEQLVGAPYLGMTSKDYRALNKAFLSNWKHPKYKVGYQGLTYQPMKELVNYLQSKQFKVYIYTADEGDFLRPIAEELYNIPPENVFGSAFKHDLTFEGGKGVLTRSSRLVWFNNWANKVELIQRTFGDTVPLIAVGNSNGDEHMLHYTASFGGMSLWLHHDDEQREDKYDKHTDKLQQLTEKEQIKQINMSKDWNTVF